MIIERIPKDDRTNLLMALNKLTQSFNKRGVSILLSAHSENVATITLLVTGKRGTAQKIIAVVYNQGTNEWEGFCDGLKFKLLALNEISGVVKSQINNLSNLLHKI